MMQSDDLIPTLPLLPSDALCTSLGHACLQALPWLNQAHRDEEEISVKFENEMGSTLKELVRLEYANLAPRGHTAVSWAHREKRYGTWWRPHRLDEVFVEAFFPWWKKAVECRPPYVAVISSGPYGGIETVYVNGREIYQLPPDIHPDLFEKWKSEVCARESSVLDFGYAAERYGAICVSSETNTCRILSETKS